MMLLPDLLLLGGIALCLLSAVLAVVQLVQTQPPRAAILVFMAGILVLVIGASVDPDTFHPDDIPSAFARVTGIQIGN
ncbi:hypothetical protein [Paracoccus sp. JM45]|uniref:hypothetical protein n=1 Tax=Paracoccus sp. JM45 TaxID=2283626 RepID=UPI000E6C9B55|nr:hypothetical protein [Paracoccus sp. JM45]RJE81704.1 hypothetical protein DWB67_03555 [Paracoccus sp. JM45]